MGSTFHNTITNSGSGEQNIAQGDGAIAKQVNNSNAPQASPQASPEELLKLLTEIKERLPELPDKEQVKLRNAVEEVEMEAKEDKPDKEGAAPADGNEAGEAEAVATDGIKVPGKILKVN